MLTVGVPVELPKTAANSLPSDQEEPLTVTLTAEGQILIQSAEIEESTLIAKLRAVAAERQNDKIFLRADGAIPYERVVQVMGALNAGGFSNIGLVTDVGGPAFDGPVSDGSEASPRQCRQDMSYQGLRMLVSSVGRCLVVCSRPRIRTLCSIMCRSYPSRISGDDRIRSGARGSAV